MKKLFITTNGAILLDTEKEEACSVPSCKNGIRSVYLVKEDTHVIYQSGTIKQEVYAEAGDMLIVFYALDDFKYKLVVAKSAQWAENIKLYEEAEQKRKEEWAAKHAEAEEAVSIGCCPPNTAADIS